MKENKDDSQKPQIKSVIKVSRKSIINLLITNGLLLLGTPPPPTPKHQDLST